MNTEKLVLANGTEFPVVVGGAYSSGDSLYLKFQTENTLESIMELFGNRANTETLKVVKDEETILMFNGFTSLDSFASIDTHYETEAAQVDETGITTQEAVYSRVASITLHKESVEEQVKTLNKKVSPAFAAASFMAPTFTDAQALQVKELYPEWESCVNGSLHTGDRVTYNGHLYKVRQEISVVLENQAPGIETAALYEEIVEDHEGTFTDPIPYNNNMELFNGKYYSQNGVVYKCNRDTQQAVYNPLADLVGIYVEIATE